MRMQKAEEFKCYIIWYFKSNKDAIKISKRAPWNYAIVIKKKSIKTTYFAFLDPWRKAFDWIPEIKVWESLRKRGVNIKLIRVIKRLSRIPLNMWQPKTWNQIYSE